MEKGSVTELQEKGVSNTTVDPLYKKVLQNNKPDEDFVGENEKKSDVGHISGKVTPLPTEVKGLQIPQEDRAIEVVSSALYWN